MERLTNTLSSLSHLNLEGHIVRKQPLQAGLGGTCDVFTAWSNKHDQKVAVKRIRVFMRKDAALAKRLAKEIGIWAKLDHECVLPFLGYLVEGDDLIPSLVSEWQERGTLNDFMKKFPRGGEDTWNMLNWIASGLEYLHAEGVVHADLKSHNILISENNTPLLADFGLSTALSQTMMGTATCTTNGTVRWMAVELMVEQSVHTKMTDVWAFGMVAYELLSGNLPYCHLKSDIQVIPAIIKGNLPAKPENEHHLELFDILWSMCQTCWDKDPTERPTATELCVLLSTPASTLVSVTDNDVDEWKPNVLDGVRSESPVDMSAGFWDSEDDCEPVVPLKYEHFVRELKDSRRFSTPATGTPSNPKAIGSPTRSTFPQRKASMRGPDNRTTLDNLKARGNPPQRIDTGYRNPISEKKSPLSNRPRPQPSKSADGQIFFHGLDTDSLLSSPGKRRKWSLHDASLTNSILRLERFDDPTAKQKMNLRDGSERLMYKLKILAPTTMPVEGSSIKRRIYPFALVGASNNMVVSRFAAVSEEERDNWVGAFTVVAGVEVQAR